METPGARTEIVKSEPLHQVHVYKTLAPLGVCCCCMRCAPRVYKYTTRAHNVEKKVNNKTSRGERYLFIAPEGTPPVARFYSARVPAGNKETTYNAPRMRTMLIKHRERECKCSRGLSSSHVICLRAASFGQRPIVSNADANNPSLPFIYSQPHTKDETQTISRVDKSRNW